PLRAPPSTLFPYTTLFRSIRSVSFNIEYEVNERHRDIEFSRWCRRQQVEVHKFHDQCIIPPGEVLTQQGQPFKVFTPFKRAWFKDRKSTRLNSSHVKISYA